MALIESLDDIKSSCVKFREEAERYEIVPSQATSNLLPLSYSINGNLDVNMTTYRDEVELSASEELSVTDDSLNSKTDVNTTISPPPKRRNSYR